MDPRFAAVPRLSRIVIAAAYFALRLPQVGGLTLIAEAATKSVDELVEAVAIVVDGKQLLIDIADVAVGKA